MAFGSSGGSGSRKKPDAEPSPATQTPMPKERVNKPAELREEPDSVSLLDPSAGRSKKKSGMGLL